ncbi:MAG: hypothetical protein ACLQDV_27040 [Candidatus Binataceae bacterium]
MNDYAGASVEAKLREFAVAFLKSEAMLAEMLRGELSKRHFAYRARKFSFTAASDSYLRQNFSQKLSPQIDVRT